MMVKIGVMLLAAVILATGARAEGEGAIAASIAPLHSIVSAIAGPDEPVALLIPAGQSPHTYALRPSTAATIEQADVIFRIGLGYESAIEKPIANLKSGQADIEIASAPGLKLLAARSLSEAGEGHDDHGHGHQDHDHAGDTDPHLWLDPVNALAIADVVVTALSARRPDRAATYVANGERLKSAIRALDERLARRLAPVADVPFVVFHDGYQYFEVRYGLSIAGAVTVAADRPPSARQVSALRAKIKETGARCVFTEPQFEPRLVETIIEGLEVRTAVIDGLGAAIATGEGLYVALLDELGASVAGCLGQD